MPDPLYSSRWTQIFEVTPGPGPVAGTPNDSNGKPVPYISGFMVDVDGTIEIIGKEGPNEPVTLTVIAGYQYHIACRSVLAIAGGVTTVIGGL